VYEADHSFLSSAGVKDYRGHGSSLPYAFLACTRANITLLCHSMEMVVFCHTMLNIDFMGLKLVFLF
jgi:hypothetical protein